ncbi:energy transducer TonB [bacterium]|nr:energy transducer TonB [bacterium]
MKPEIIIVDFDDIVFENRNKSYGAYPLRKHSGERLMWITISVLAFLLSTGLSYYRNLETPLSKIFIEKSVEICLAESPSVCFPAPPPPQLTRCFFGGSNYPRMYHPVPEDMVLEEDIPILNEIQKNGKEGYPGINGHQMVEIEPIPQNHKEVREMIGYPEIARDAGIEGIVVIRVLVDKKGKYVKHKVIKKVHPILGGACEKHIHKLKFTPAIHDGKAIPFWVNIPFRFHFLT